MEFRYSIGETKFYDEPKSNNSWVMKIDEREYRICPKNTSLHKCYDGKLVKLTKKDVDKKFKACNAQINGKDVCEQYLSNLNVNKVDLSNITNIKWK
ncbi:hypothetical protein CMI39_02860 [Candidatus Pacearchaeota archaeon]|jgi:hypothetical protein|nr:hypothetical protein [Candidatus Pacearchaeota archaeon]|tara:strand:+ start:313 stop:603 length:291 start_codon:yes stop_codon:yes gene_type:complete